MDGRKVALLTIHGMGQQRPHQLTDSFVRGISNAFSDAQPVLEHILESGGSSEDPVPGFVRMTFSNGPATVGPNSIATLDIHEVYWADRVTGIARVWAVIQWLAYTALIPIRAWAHQATVVAPSTPTGGTRMKRMLEEVVRAALLPLIPIAIAALLFAGYSSRTRLGDAANGLTTLWDDIGNPLVTVGLVCLTLTAIGMVWGAFRLHKIQPHYTASDDLRHWSIWSFLGGAVLLGAAMLLAEASNLTYGTIIARIGESLRTAILPLALLGIAWMLNRFVVGSVGDVMIYMRGINALSPHATKRAAIRGLALDALKRLTEVDAEEEIYKYDAVYVSAHSLGSVIAYDALNRFSVEHAAYLSELKLDRKPHDLATDGRTARFDRVHGFLSFGSPLDKIYYFFRVHTKPEHVIRAQILSSLDRLRKVSSGRVYEPHRFEYYAASEPRPFEWWNAWAHLDPLGHRLDFYRVDQQPLIGAAGLKGLAKLKVLNSHSIFWSHPWFYESVTRLLTQPVFKSVRMYLHNGTIATWQFEGSGWGSGTTVTAEIGPFGRDGEEDDEPVTLTCTADADGAVNWTSPVASSLPDGKYSVQLTSDPAVRTKSRLVEVVRSSRAAEQDNYTERAQIDSASADA